MSATSEPTRPPASGASEPTQADRLLASAKFYTTVFLVLFGIVVVFAAGLPASVAAPSRPDVDQHELAITIIIKREN